MKERRQKRGTKREANTVHVINTKEETRERRERKGEEEERTERKARTTERQIRE